MRVLSAAVLMISAVFLCARHPTTAAAVQSGDPHRAHQSHSLTLHPGNNPSTPLFTVGITGGFTGATMMASVYLDGTVRTVRSGLGSSSTVDTRVPLSRGAVQTVIKTAARTHVFAIPRSVQDTVFGADIPVLSFRIATVHGVRSVHVIGTEGSHPAGSQAFFPIWNLLYAIAGYPPQFHAAQ